MPQYIQLKGTNLVVAYVHNVGNKEKLLTTAQVIRHTSVTSTPHNLPIGNLQYSKLKLLPVFLQLTTQQTE